MEELARVLSRERLLLERLLFRLVELGQLLSADDERFLSWAADDTGRAIDTVREAELHRAMVLAHAAADLDLPADTSLREVAERSPDPYRTIFAEHRAALLALTADVEALLTVTHRLASAGADAVADLLDRAVAPEPVLSGTAVVSAYRARPRQPAVAVAVREARVLPMQSRGRDRAATGQVAPARPARTRPEDADFTETVLRLSRAQAGYGAALAAATGAQLPSLRDFLR